MVVKMVVRPIAKLSEGPAANESKGLRPFWAALRDQALCLVVVFKAHLRPDQLRGSWTRD
jgi:hypothetical protein